jgi:hypothetical protein
MKLKLSQTDFDAFLTVFACGQMLDVMTTVLIVMWGGREANPVMSALLGSGYLVFALAKVALVLAIGLASYSIFRKAPGYFALVVMVVVVVTYLGPFSNVLQLILGHLI